MAHAALHHRRSPTDARLRSLCRAAFARGKAARRFDAWRECCAIARARARTLARLHWPRCALPLPSGADDGRHSCWAHCGSAARSAQLVARDTAPADSDTDTNPTDTDTDTAQVDRESYCASAADQAANGRLTDDFLSGESGTVGGLDGMRRAALDIADDALRDRIHPPAAPRRRRASSIRRGDGCSCCAWRAPSTARSCERIRDELAARAIEVELCVGAPADRGKFENLNLLLDPHPADAYDWLFVVDDDIVLPRGFLDRFLLLAERFELDLAQPAHRRASHAAWQVTRRQAATAWCARRALWRSGP